jgi:hypothetical protein
MGVAINSSRPPLLDHVIYAYFYSIVELKLLILSRAFKITVISRTGLKVDKLAGRLQVRLQVPVLPSAMLVPARTSHSCSTR